MTYHTPKKNAQYIFPCALVESANRPQLKANPTLAAGDVKVERDGVSLGNITTLPVAAPAGGRTLMVTLSADEMNGDNVVVLFVDQTSPREWDELLIPIQPSARAIDDLAFPNTSGRGMDVDASGGVEVGSFQAGAITAAAIATDAVDADALAADAISEIWNKLTSGLSTVGSVGKLIVDYLDAAITSRAAAATAVSSADLTPTRAAKLDNLDAAISTVATLGAGAIEWTYTLTDGSNPIADADIWVTTDLAGTNVIASGRTDQNGEITFYLDAGTVYVWRSKTGWTATNPDTEVVA